MKKIYMITVFISINLFFIFFLVYKNSVMLKLSFQKQSYEKQKTTLVNHKEELQAQLCSLQNRGTIQQFVQRKLKMEKINRKQIKEVPHLS